MGNKYAKMNDESQFVADAIEKYPVLVFSKTYCPYCHKAKRAIDDAATSVPGFPGAKIFELDAMGARGRAVQNALAAKTGRTTVPNVFINGQNVGGGDEVAALHRGSKLVPLLKRAAATASASDSSAAAPAQKPDPPFDPKTFVTDAIKNHPVLVFSKSYCPYCHMAKNAIAAAGKSVEGFAGAQVYELDNMGAKGADIQAVLAELTDRFTVPNVFIGGQNVGGGDDVAALHGRGELVSLMANAVSGGASQDEAEVEAPFDAKTFVADAVANNPAVVFSKSYCPYCHAAKIAIAEAGAKVEGFDGAKVLELDEMGAQGEAIQRELAELTGRTTVPNVFIGGVNVGGGDDVTGLHARDELAPMLSKAVSGEEADAPFDAKKFVADAIATHPTLVFSKSFCPYCRAAKSAIAEAGTHVADFAGAKVFELDEMGAQGEAIQRELAELTGRTTVPNVFIGGVNVGGGDDVTGLQERNVLKQMLAQAPVRLASGAGSAADAAPAPAVNMDGSPQEVVDALIASAPVAMFAKSYCRFCKKAKQLLAEAGASVSGYTDASVVELDEEGMERGGAMQAYLAEKTGQTSVPNIFIEGVHIGGCDDLQALADNGELAGKLEAAFANRAANAPPKPDAAAPKLQRITLGAGCFWGVELAFQRVEGVTKTQVGYSNGRSGPIRYEEVCSGETGAAEVVRVTYDPAIVSLGELLKVWEERHDVTSLNRQGNDVGTQYRSAIFWEDESQGEEVEAWRRDAEQRGLNVATQIAQVTRYNAAEGYHQQYLQKRGQSALKGATERIRCYG